jgi:bifunctional NMN adenylyltransferase/nudix hydrolase
MSKKYDTLVLIGRFQPFHNAHLLLASRATALAKNLVFICGSANQPFTYKNPFTFDERSTMIYETTRILGGTLTVSI